MSAGTAIEWTEATWNPTTGCDRVSPGCDHCYALTLARRLKAMGSAKYQNDGDPRTSGPGFGVAVHPEVLDEPYRWRKPKRVFVNSMSDLFHARVPVTFIERVFEVMAATPRHTYQLLTKRASRLARLAHRLPWPDNVWIGVSVESEAQADSRLPYLIQVPAAVRFVSAEPLLGPVDLSPWLSCVHQSATGAGGDVWRCDHCSAEFRSDGVEEPKVVRPGRLVNWVIVGGESGPTARPMHPDWARGLRDQCAAAGVPFFFKQWGMWAPAPWRVDREPGETAQEYKTRAEATCATHGYPVWADHYDHMVVPAGHQPWSAERTSLPRTHAGIRRVGKAVAGRLLDGRTWDEYPGVA